MPRFTPPPAPRPASSRPTSTVRSLLAFSLTALLALGASSAGAGVAPSSPDGPASSPGDQAAKPAPPETDARPTDVLGAALGADNVRNLDTGVAYNTLAEAVDAASAGDTLQVETPVLPQGQIAIDKSLTLRGQTGAEVVQASQSTGDSGDDRAWFLVPSGVVLDVEDLNFDGNAQQIYNGFRLGGSGSFTDVSFTDIQYEPTGPAFAGFAIVAFGDGTVDVASSTFSQIGRVGILYFGDGVDGSTVRDVVYTGKGAGPFLDYAVEVGAGAEVSIVGTDIRANLGVVPDPDAATSAGVLLTTFFGPGTAATVVSTNFENNAIGIAIGADASDSSTLTAEANRIVGNTTGIEQQGTGVADAERQWWGCNAGPNAVGCDTVSGTVDADPWLVLEITTTTLCAGFLDHVVASLRGDSDGVTDRSPALPTVPGFDAVFTDDDGSIEMIVPVVGGSADAEYPPSPPTTNEMVTATVDSQTVDGMFDIVTNLFCDGFESGGTSAWSSTAP